MRRSITTTVGAAILTLTCALAPVAHGPARAQSDKPDAHAVHPFETAAVTVKGHQWAIIQANNVVLLGIPVDAGHLTRQQRAHIIAYDRLGKLFGTQALSRRDNYVVTERNGEIIIGVKAPQGAFTGPKTETGEALLLTIDRNFEKFLGHSRRDIAYYWIDLIVANMRRAQISSGEFTLQPDARDPAGRPMDAERSWMQIPDGYSRKYR